MMLAWLSVAYALEPNKPEGALPGAPEPQCRPTDALLEQLRPSLQAFGACLAGAKPSPSGPSFTIAADGSVTAKTGTGDPARDACAAKAVASLKLPALPEGEQCAVTVSWPLSVDPVP